MERRTGSTRLTGMPPDQVELAAAVTTTCFAR